MKPDTCTSISQAYSAASVDLTAPAWLAALGVFAAFGAFTVLFWAWFRFRPSPVAIDEG